MGSNASPLIRNFLLGRELSKQREQDREDKERKKIDDKRTEEEFKLRISNLKLQQRKFKADLDKDSVEAESIFNQERIEALQGNRPLIRGVQGEPDFFSTSGESIPQEESKVFQGLTGEIEIPVEELEAARQFEEEQSQQGLQGLSDEAVAKETGRFLSEDMKNRGRFALEQEKSKLSRAENTQEHQLRLEELKEASKLRITGTTLKQQVQGTSQQNSASIADWTDRIFNLRNNIKDIKDNKLRDQVRLELNSQGIIDFPDIKSHQEYVESVGAIDSVFDKVDSFIGKQFKVDPKKIDLIPQPRDPSIVDRAFANIFGVGEEFFDSTEEAKLSKEMDTLLGFISNQTGGDRGSRLSDQDLKLAKINLPKLTDTLRDSLRKRRNLRKIFQDNFDRFYADLSFEQQSTLITKLNLPFTPSGVRTKSKKQSFKINNPKVIAFAKSEGVSPEEAVTILIEQQKGSQNAPR